MRHTTIIPLGTPASFALTTLLLLLAPPAVADETNSLSPSTTPPAVSATSPHNVPSILESDGRLRFQFGDEQLVLSRGLQPSLLCTSAGTLVVQGQLPEKPFPANRMTYPYALATVVSRDNGNTWKPIPLRPGENGLNMEGGAVQLRDGTILALDTYIMPGTAPGKGIGQLYTSNDDWQTLLGPKDVPFDLPDVNFEGSSDDGGRPHNAQRLHRRIIEMPNGDLLTTFYGWLDGDNSSSTYRPTMIRTRMMLARSTNKGQSWKLVSNVSIDPTIGTEGLGEPVVCRVGKGPNAGRLICLMRTGRNLYETISDDEGATWSPAKPLIFAGLDVERTELWVDMFRKFKDFKGQLLDENNLDELRGAVVDPDLIELRSGLLVAAFGVRVPQKLCWRHPEHPWNGNYLAFSDDHGATWENVVRMTSGVVTTHYMAIEETPTDNLLYVTYDLGGWSKGMRRDIYGRTMQVSAKR